MRMRWRRRRSEADRLVVAVKADQLAVAVEAAAVAAAEQQAVAAGGSRLWAAAAAAAAGLPPFGVEGWSRVADVQSQLFDAGT